MRYFRSSFHIRFHFTEEMMLERAPAVAVEMISTAKSDTEDSRSHHSASSSDALDLSSDRMLTRLVVAPFVMKICSGSIHRLKMIVFSASQYQWEDYPQPQSLRK